MYFLFQSTNANDVIRRINVNDADVVATAGNVARQHDDGGNAMSCSLLYIRKNDGGNALSCSLLYISSLLYIKSAVLPRVTRSSFHLLNIGCVSFSSLLSLCIYFRQISISKQNECGAHAHAPMYSKITHVDRCRGYNTVMNTGAACSQKRS